MRLLSAQVPELLRLSDLAALTRVSRSQLHRLIKSGELRVVRFGRRGGIRVPKRELERFLDQKLSGARHDGNGR